jgi:hypothetical protein
MLHDGLADGNAESQCPSRSPVIGMHRRKRQSHGLEERFSRNLGGMLDAVAIGDGYAGQERSATKEE